MHLPPTVPKPRYGYRPANSSEITPVHESDVLTYLEENLAEQWGPGKTAPTYAINTFQVATTGGDIFTWEVAPIHVQAGDSIQVTFHF